MRSTLRLSRAALVLAVSMGSLGPVRASAQPAAPTETAGSLAARARAAYELGNFADAATLYRQAYDRKPDPTLLFNLGRCHEALGRSEDLQRAVSAYTQYLTESKDPPDRAAVERRMDALRAQIAVLDRASLPSDALPTSPPRPELARPAAAPISPWPWILAGLGTGGVGAGIGLGVAATDAHDAAQASLSGAEAADLASRANALGVGATLGFVAGGALAAAGIVWGIVDVTASRSTNDGVSLLFAPDGVHVAGRF